MVLAFLHRDASADCLEHPLDIPAHGAAFYEALPPLFAWGVFCNHCREHLLQSLFKKIRHIGDGTGWHIRSYAGDAHDLLSAQAPHDAPPVVWSIFKSGIAVPEQFLWLAQRDLAAMCSSQDSQAERICFFWLAAPKHEPASLPIR